MENMCAQSGIGGSVKRNFLQLLGNISRALRLSGGWFLIDCGSVRLVKYGLAPGGIGRRLSSAARYGRAHSIHHNISVNNAGREGDTVSPLTDGKERDFTQLMQHKQNSQNVFEFLKQNYRFS